MIKLFSYFEWSGFCVNHTKIVERLGIAVYHFSMNSWIRILSHGIKSYGYCDKTAERQKTTNRTKEMEKLEIKWSR
jgi:hypothetical protein